MTTSPGSANAEAMPANRRSFLSTLAAAGALGLPVLPALAAPIAPGPIETMWPEHLRLEAAYDAACERTWDAEERYEEPERPKWTLNDEGGHEIIITSPGRGLCLIDVSDKNIERLKQAIALEHVPDDPGDAGHRNALHGRMARRTLAKIETWRAEMLRRKKAAGLIKAEAEEETARTAAYAHRNAILAIKAATFRELAFQAAVLDLDVEWTREHAESLLERLTELAGVTSYGLA